MKKKVIGLALALALVVSSIFAYQHFSGNEGAVFAMEFRNGIGIEPLEVDYSGVHIDSDFMFTWENDENKVTLDQLKKGLTIRPNVDVEISESDDGLLVHPLTMLKKGTIYVFEFDGVTFAYKTETDFSVIGTFPRHQATNVPVNTGIEFMFNHEGADVEDYFSIEPSVKGTFEEHGKVIAFVPKELEEATVYTVTLKEGLSIKGADKVLTEDVSFSFETEMKANSNRTQEYLMFRSFISEFNTGEAPSIMWDFYSDDGEETTSEIEVYAYKDVESFVSAVDNSMNVPTWSWYGGEQLEIDIEGLDKVMEFSAEMINDYDRPSALQLPDQLEAGYYVVKAEFGDALASTYIQVTDLSFYYNQSANGDLLWVHDLTSGQAVKGVKLSEVTVDEDVSIDGLDLVSDDEGLVFIEKERESSTGQTKIFFLESDDKSALCYSSNMNYWWRGYRDNQLFWKYFKTDRSLYKPTDEVSFFGFLSGRYEEVDADKVSVELSKGGYYYWDYLPFDVDELSYVSTEVKLNNGFFEGSFSLPALEEGGYEVKVKVDDEVVSSTYITVEEYVKPSYKLEVTSDKEAVFVGEPIEIVVKSQFFEGTPVSYLDFEYNLDGVDYENSRETTDKLGEYRIDYIPEYRSGYQDQINLYFSAYAQLPESGNIWVNDNYRVFFNDIHVDYEAQVEDGEGMLSVNVHTITLDRLNDGTAKDYNDFLDEPVENQVIYGTIYRNEWIKTEAGEYYDYINKEVRKRYDYNLETREFDEVRLETDSEGFAKLHVNLPEEDDVYYTAKIETVDGNVRNMEYEVYFGRDYYYPNWRNHYELQLDKEVYQIDDDVNVSMVYGDEEIKGDFLFIAAQQGIMDVEVNDKQEAQFTFSEKYVPNVEISGVYFNGSTYLSAGNVGAVFDTTEREIKLDIELNQEGYRPGEEVKATISAYYMVGNDRVAVKDALVNVGLIDEALLALSDVYIDPISELYRYVDGGIYQTYSSHYNENAMYFGAMTADTDEAAEAVMEMPASMDMAKSAVMDQNALSLTFTEGGSDGGGISIRSEFKDTAYYATVELNDKGEGDLAFTLPHNVTQWRLTGAAISTELMAGSEVTSVDVSLPFFLNTSLNTTYLVGDKPMVGVTAYGSELEGNEEIEFEITVLDEDENRVHSSKVLGQVFERSNLELGEFTKEGHYTIIITGSIDGGLSDGLEMPVSVVETYHEQFVTDYYDVEAGLKVSTNESGNTVITFTDQGVGYYLPELYNLSFAGGKRVDQAYLGNLVRTFLNEEFEAGLELNNVSLNEYKSGDGGIGILPYAESDPETTVNMIKVLDDGYSQAEALLYLQNKWYDKNFDEKAIALYGFTLLGEPVLDDLNYYSQASNLSDKELLYLSMAYSEIGDSYMAKVLYKRALADSVEELELVAHIGGDYEMTSLAMMAASKLDIDEADKFYTYVTTNYSKEYLPNLLVYAYILDNLKSRTDVSGAISYTYNGRDGEIVLDKGYARSLTIPSATLNSFEITSVTGDVRAAYTYLTSMVDEVTNDDNLQVSRSYYNYYNNEKTNSFKEGDLVKVVLDWKVADDAVDGYYRLTDFVPAGLKPIENPYQLGLNRENGMYWFRDFDGQKVDFYIYKDKTNHTYEPVAYYARIVSLGEFKAEAPLIQGVRNADSMLIGETDSIVITE